MNPFHISCPDWRPSTAKEIQSYYKHVFPITWKSLPEYITKSSSSEYAFAFLRPVKTLERNTIKEKDFLRRANRNMESLKKLQNLLLDFKRFDPAAAVVESSQIESLYFSLKMADESWLLAFDIDAKNVAMSGMCEHHLGLKPDADDAEVISWRRMIGGIPPVHPQHIKDPDKGYLYCFNCLQIAINKAFELKRTLIEWGFSPGEIRIYYSGQGAHVHITDPDAWNYPRPARDFIAKQLANHKQIPIDTMVTIDSRRVLRFPGSLHGGVNRRVQELIHPYDLEEIIAGPNYHYV